MRRTTLALVPLLLAMAACSRPAAPTAETPAPATAATPVPSAALPPTTTVAPPPASVPEVPAPTTAPPATPPGDQLARFDGYGDLRFGMTAQQARQAWGGDLNGKPGPGEACYYLNPTSNPAPSYFAFMIENDKFVRYDVGNDKEVAPGGGKRGMSADEIGRLYAGRIQESPHKYVPGGKVLRIKDSAGNGVLVFETDAAGKVTEWRVGVPPQVDYVEGCS